MRRTVSVRMLRVLLAGGLILLASAAVTDAAYAQTGLDTVRVSIAPRAREDHRSVGLANAIRLDVRLVLIPVTVTGPLGEPRSGLPRRMFHVFEGGVEQTVRYFANEDAPVSLGVVFDSSGSMEHRLDKSREAVGQLFQTAMPGDEFFLLEFNDSPRLLCNFTSRPEEIQSTLLNIQPKGWTALFDAVYLAVHKMKRAQNPRHALLILSDGGDNSSRYSEAEIKSLVREADVCIYSIAILGSGLSGRNVRLLRNLSEETGGRVYTVEKKGDLPAAVARMSAALRDQYVLGYSPSNLVSDGKYRKVEVRLEQGAEDTPLHASWRVGYYAPAGR